MSISPAEAWSTSDVVLQFKVHLGLWTNWSRGKILGQTLTMTRGNADLLIAFTGVFITFVGARFWRITCLALHRSFSSSKSQDAIYHQQQVILRNSSTADSGVAKILQLYWAWRSPRLLIRLLPALVTAAFCFVAFTVAGGFSSQISSSVGAEVLVRGDNCSIYTVDPVDYTLLFQTYSSQRIDNALNYVQQCYSANSSGLIDCQSFATERIPSFINTAAACPFQAGLCRSEASNLILDTGYIDSHTHLGVNAPQEDRILFRQMAECAPIVTANRTSPSPHETYNQTLYNFGKVMGVGSNAGKFRNYTFAVDSIETQYHEALTKGTILTSEFSLQSILSNNFNGTPVGPWIPEPALSRADADIYLIYIQGKGVVFEEPMDDDWYRATTPYLNMSFSGSAVPHPSYHSDEAASPLACALRYQLCIADLSSCSPLTGWYDAVGAVYGLAGLDSNYYFQNFLSNPWDSGIPENPVLKRLDWFTNVIAASPGNPNEVINMARSRALASRKTLADGIQYHLPQNQWQIDVTHWWATMQATLQDSFVSVANGRFSQAPIHAQKLPNGTDQADMCQNQKIRSAEYASFNFFALLFTYIVGGVLVALSFVLDPILQHLQERHGYQRYTQLEWTANDTMQLHRLAHEGTGAKEWLNCTQAIPTTRPGVSLAGLDISNAKHPRLTEKALWATETLVTSNSQRGMEKMPGKGSLSPASTMKSQTASSKAEEKEDLDPPASARNSELPRLNVSHIDNRSHE